jgi:hypothetical protein
MSFLQDLEARIATTRAPVVGEEAARLEARARVRALLAVPIVLVGVAAGTWAQLGGSPALWLLVLACVVAFAQVARNAMTIARQSDRLARGHQAGIVQVAASRGEPLPPSVRLAPRAAELAPLIGDRAARRAALAEGLSVLMRYFLIAWVIVSALLVVAAPFSAVVPAAVIVLILVEGSLLGGRGWLDRRTEQAADAYVGARLGHPVHLGRGHRTNAQWETAIARARHEHER